MRSAEGRPELRKEVVEGVASALDAGELCADHEPDELAEVEEREGRRVENKRPIDGGAPENKICEFKVSQFYVLWTRLPKNAGGR